MNLGVTALIVILPEVFPALVNQFQVLTLVEFHLRHPFLVAKLDYLFERITQILPDSGCVTVDCRRICGIDNLLYLLVGDPVGRLGLE